MTDATVDDPALHDHHAERATALLRRAIDCGYNDFEKIQVDAHFDPLRGRADFAELIRPGKPGRQYAGVWICPPKEQEPTIPPSTHSVGEESGARVEPEQEYVRTSRTGMIRTGTRTARGSPSKATGRSPSPRPTTTAARLWSHPSGVGPSSARRSETIRPCARQTRRSPCS